MRGSRAARPSGARVRPLGASLETRRTDRRCAVNRLRVQPRRGIAPVDRGKRPGIRNWSDERSSRRRTRESSGRLRRASQESERVRILAPTPSSRRPMSNCQRHPFALRVSTRLNVVWLTRRPAVRASRAHCEHEAVVRTWPAVAGSAPGMSSTLPPGAGVAQSVRETGVKVDFVSRARRTLCSG